MLNAAGEVETLIDIAVEEDLAMRVEVKLTSGVDVKGGKPHFMKDKKEVGIAQGGEGGIEVEKSNGWGGRGGGSLNRRGTMGGVAVRIVVGGYGEVVDTREM